MIPCLPDCIPDKLDCPGWLGVERSMLWNKHVCMQRIWDTFHTKVPKGNPYLIVGYTVPKKSVPALSIILRDSSLMNGPLYRLVISVPDPFAVNDYSVWHILRDNQDQMALVTYWEQTLRTESLQNKFCHYVSFSDIIAGHDYIQTDSDFESELFSPLKYYCF